MLREFEAIILDQWQTLGLRGEPPSRLSFVLLSESLYARGAIGVLAFRDAGRQPVVFAKVARDPDRDEQVAREYEILSALHERGDAWVRGAIARPLFRRRIAGEWVAAVSAFSGPTMLDEIGRRGRGGFCRSVAAGHFRLILDWLVRLSRPMGVRRPLSQEDLERHVLDPISLLYEGRPRAPQVESFVDQVRGLVGHEMLMVPVHNDLHPNNVILEPGSPPRVVDWETALLQGLPFHDLFYFTTFYRLLQPRPRGKERRFERAYWTPGWYLDLVGAAAAEYAAKLGIELALADTLFPLHLLERGARCARRGRKAGRDQVRHLFERALGWSVPRTG
jgi:hypothetical protein